MQFDHSIHNGFLFLLPGNSCRSHGDKRSVSVILGEAVNLQIST